jgi:MSHA biogenesis protein MshO
MPAITSHESRITGRASRRRGFTLVEMIVVIAITGIVAAAVAVFIKRPVEGYVDAARRAEMTDIADTALRRITRDLRSALPNSIRVTTAGPVTYLEYLQTSGGGRYRADPDSGGGGDILDFSTADTAFDVIGPVPALTGTESIVVYNLTADPGTTTANAYFGDNRGTDANGAGPVNFTAPAPLGTSSPFPFASPGKRFHVVQYPVTYECAPDPVNPANGVLRRYSNYPITLAQPTPPGGGVNALLATGVAACGFTYTTGGATGRMGVVALTLQISQSGENVRLFQQAHVSNVP